MLSSGARNDPVAELAARLSQQPVAELSGAGHGPLVGVLSLSGRPEERDTDEGLRRVVAHSPSQAVEARVQSRAGELLRSVVVAAGAERRRHAIRQCTPRAEVGEAEIAIEL